MINKTPKKELGSNNIIIMPTAIQNKIKPMIRLKLPPHLVHSYFSICMTLEKKTYFRFLFLPLI